MDVDVLLIGGGIAGLWSLDHLRRAGYRAILLENRALGTGQTIGSQGIIHGGLKYSLRGMLTASADEIREMPVLWRECLSGQIEPNLQSVQVRSHCCYLWQTADLSSQAGMLGAQLQLRVKPQALAAGQRPDLLQQTPGQVFRLDEQVVSPASLLACFRKRHQDYLFLGDAQRELNWERDARGRVTAVNVTRAGEQLRIQPGCVVLTAGAGNAALSQETGKLQPMQRRPLQMVLVRGNLPAFQGHCIDGAKTRLTITSEVVSARQTVWQLGGQIAEQGVALAAEELILHARQELQATLPGLSLDGLQWATYRIDRAERKSGMGLRPDAPQFLRHQNVITCWPTKLAFAPRVAQSLHSLLQRDLQLHPSAGTNETAWLPERGTWPVPPVALPPWEDVSQWYEWTSAGLLPVNGTQSQAA